MGVVMIGAKPEAGVGEAIVREVCVERWGDRRDPGAKEVRQADDLVRQWGVEDVMEAIPILVQLMRERWPDAVRWGATMAYWPEAVREVRRQRHERERPAREAAQKQAEKEEMKRDADERKQRESEWDRLPADARADIEAKMKQRYYYLKPDNPLFKHVCC